MFQETLCIHSHTYQSLSPGGLNKHWLGAKPSEALIQYLGQGPSGGFAPEGMSAVVRTDLCGNQWGREDSTLSVWKDHMFCIHSYNFTIPIIVLETL